jgi:hypothetical protein
VQCVSEGQIWANSKELRYLLEALGEALPLRVVAVIEEPRIEARRFRNCFPETNCADCYDRSTSARARTGRPTRGLLIALSKESCQFFSFKATCCM